MYQIGVKHQHDGPHTGSQNRSGLPPFESFEHILFAVSMVCPPFTFVGY
jgi:hypothetical protein